MEEERVVTGGEGANPRAGGGELGLGREEAHGIAAGGTGQCQVKQRKAQKAGQMIRAEQIRAPVQLATSS